MTEIQTGHSSLSANNDAEMLQKELLSYAIKADVFIMCLFLLLWATLLDPVLLFSSLLGNCLQEPCEETLSIPGPARVGQMWACHLVQAPSNGQCVRAGACRCLSQAPALQAGLQLTPNFTFHGQKAHFSWLNIIDPIFSKCYVLIKE